MATNDESILETIKTALGVAADYDVYDEEIKLFINSALGELNQLGIGPEEGFEIETGEEKWSELLGDKLYLSGAKTLIVLQVRMLWDPPGTGYLLNTYEKLLLQQQWRLEVAQDERNRPAPADRRIPNV